MKKIIIYLFILTLLPFTSCKDWLSVDPEDQILEDKLYETENGIYSVVNGLYMGLASGDLYGKNLTMTALELLGQQYSTTVLDNTDNPIALQLVEYNYKEKDTKTLFYNIWKQMYARILEINKFIHKIEETDILTEEKKNILLGEVYGLRAFIHFDLLRLFGPVYVENPDKLSIPYTQTTGGERSPFLPASEIIDLVLKDISKAADYLKVDPIIKEGPLASLTEEPLADFYRFRNRRMNYYAVKALQARVLLYKGDATEAANVADEVITVAEQYFPWTPEKNVLDKDNPDRIFSSELIFGIYNNDMYSHWTKHFSPSLQDKNLYGALETVLKARVFTEKAENFVDYKDVRAKLWSNISNRTVRPSVKYEDAQKDTCSIRYVQPLIRLSEMYYIKTEEALLRQNPVDALRYLEVVRSNRSVLPMDENASVANIETELMKEHIREFYGEGQVFYYYKRLNKPSIMNAARPTGAISMNSDKYVIPLPEEELANQ